MKYYIAGTLAFYGTVFALWGYSPWVAIASGFGACLAAWIWMYVIECAGIIKQEE